MPQLLVIAGGVLALALSAPSSYSAEKTSVKDRLIALRNRVKAIAEGKETVELTDADRIRIPTGLSDNDKMIFKALADFGQTVNDAELEAVAAFAVSKEGAGIRWGLAQLLVDRGRYDAAARAAISISWRNRRIGSTGCGNGGRPVSPIVRTTRNSAVRFATRCSANSISVTRGRRSPLRKSLGRALMKRDCLSKSSRMPFSMTAAQNRKVSIRAKTPRHRPTTASRRVPLRGISLGADG